MEDEDDTDDEEDVNDDDDDRTPNQNNPLLLGRGCHWAIVRWNNTVELLFLQVE